MTASRAASIAAVAVAVVAVPAAAADARPNPSTCASSRGTATLLAYNMTCARAKRLVKHLPPGWSGANRDLPVGPGVPDGQALLFRQRDMDRVLASCASDGRPRLVKLGHVPVVWMAAAYGE